MNGFLDGYLNKTAESAYDRLMAWRAKWTRKNPAMMKQLDMIRAMYGTDDTGDSFSYIASTRNDPPEVQKAKLKAKPQHTIKFLNSMHDKGVKNPRSWREPGEKALWSAGHGKATEEITTGIENNPEEFVSTFNIPKKAPNVSK